MQTKVNIERSRQISPGKQVNAACEGQLPGTPLVSRSRPLPVARASRKSCRQRPVQSTADVALRPSALTTSPKLSFIALRCQPASRADRYVCWSRDRTGAADPKESCTCCDSAPQSRPSPGGAAYAVDRAGMRASRRPTTSNNCFYRRWHQTDHGFDGRALAQLRGRLLASRPIPAAWRLLRTRDRPPGGRSKAARIDR